MLKANNLLFAGFLILLFHNANAIEYHVSKKGDNNNPGTREKPLLSIQTAANHARPGDTIIVHKGIYREKIIPPNGGESALKPIVYQAAPGENVSIRGSEQIEEWVIHEDNVWMVELDNAFFGNYNPYNINLSGSWLSYGSKHHVGEVYLNGLAFHEKFSLEEVKRLPNSWFSIVDNNTTRIWANFGWADPNKNLAEINVRECIIFPEKQGLKHIVIDGFEIRHAASNWAPPDQLQKGAIGTRFGYGWIIKNCRISDVKNVAISIGAVKDYHWDREYYSKPISDGQYLPDIDSFGHHLIINNSIVRCGQAGIVGTWGCVGSVIENNYISKINFKNEFGGAETAAIKLHFPIDVIIRNNYCKGVAGLQHRTKGIWLDWGVQNTRVTGNVITDYQSEGFKLEVGHGPIIIDNNLFLNSEIVQWGDAGLFMHNLFYYCTFTFKNDERIVPYYEPHSTKEAGRGMTLNNYDQYHNNIFIGNGLDGMSGKQIGTRFNHNVFLEGAQKNKDQDHESIVDAIQTEFDFQKGSHPQTIGFKVGDKLFAQVYPLITSEYIGVLPVPKMSMKKSDGSTLDIITDYLGNPIEKDSVMPGPFQNIRSDRNLFEVWPKSNK
ncbi:MAG: right-handed parallel beta-helix repeat-containing protein [Cyclobacteriaceae bacterium]|nr:right-handed parallel beta-helix repeat-containing protein [Cyclobacteriaceae bacterium]